MVKVQFRGWGKVPSEDFLFARSDSHKSPQKLHIQMWHEAEVIISLSVIKSYIYRSIRR